MLHRTLTIAARSLTVGAALTFSSHAALADHHRSDGPGTIAEVAQDAGMFNTLLAAVEAAGLTDAFTGDGPLTVFAPTDAAFAKLPDGTVESLLEPENIDRLRTILLYHAVEGAILGADALGAGQASTLAGETIEFSLRDGRLTVNDSGVIANDIEASNGVIHVIDTVLLPPSPPAPEGRLIIGVFTDEPSRALRAQLGISRGLVVTRLTNGGNAEEAGVQRFDVIAAVNGRPATSETLGEEKEKVGFGGTVELVVYRKGERISIDVPVGVDRH